VRAYRVIAGSDDMALRLNANRQLQCPVLRVS